jgi:hypothetical protein
VKMKIRIQNMEKNYKKEGKYSYYEVGRNATCNLTWANGRVE